MSVPNRDRGAIYNEKAYAQGKMLDHSSWQKGDVRLPRLITPSDVDFTIDNSGVVIFGELSSSKATWGEIESGQSLNYRHMIDGTRHIAVLCSHSVPSSDEIDTRYDVETFQAMLCVDGRILTSALYIGNDAWQDFVFGFFRDVNGTKQKLQSEIASRNVAAPSVKLEEIAFDPTDSIFFRDESGLIGRFDYPDAMWGQCDGDVEEDTVIFESIAEAEKEKERRGCGWKIFGYGQS